VRAIGTPSSARQLMGFVISRSADIMTSSSPQGRSIPMMLHRLQIEETDSFLRGTST